MSVVEQVANLYRRFREYGAPPHRAWRAAWRAVAALEADRDAFAAAVRADIASLPEVAS